MLSCTNEIYKLRRLIRKYLDGKANAEDECKLFQDMVIDLCVVFEISEDEVTKLARFIAND
jgi:hypothetical protein